MDTFSYVYNTHRENVNAIFTSEELDKSDELVDAVKDFTVYKTKYYKSNAATASEAQGNLTHNLETVTHTINGNSGQKLLSYHTIPVLPPSMNPGNGQGVALIILSPQNFLMPVM